MADPLVELAAVIDLAATPVPYEVGAVADLDRRARSHGGEQLVDLVHVVGHLMYWIRLAVASSARTSTSDFFSTTLAPSSMYSIW
jgi:hypothetical protein